MDWKILIKINNWKKKVFANNKLMCFSSQIKHVTQVCDLIYSHNFIILKFDKLQELILYHMKGYRIYVKF